MDCKEVKNLILEAQNLQALKSKQQVSSHLQECKSCQKSLLIEEKIREGFQIISEKEPPLKLFDKIVAIQKNPSPENSESEGFFNKFIQLISNFTFRVAVASALTGFCAALIFNWNNSTHIQISRQQSFSKAKSASPHLKKSTPLTRSNLAMAPASPAKTEKIGPDLPSEELKSQSHDSNDLIEVNEIPGAVSFSLKEEKKATISKEKDSMTMAYAPSANSFVESLKSSSDSRFEKKAELAVNKQLSPRSKTTILSSEMKDDIELESFHAEKNSNDSSKKIENEKAKKIENIILANILSPSDGFISLNDWVIQGVISQDEAKYLKPPHGKKWFVTQENGTYIIEAK